MFVLTVVKMTKETVKTLIKYMIIMINEILRHS